MSPSVNGRRTCHPDQISGTPPPRKETPGTKTDGRSGAWLVRVFCTGLGRFTKASPHHAVFPALTVAPCSPQGTVWRGAVNEAGHAVVTLVTLGRLPTLRGGAGVGLGHVAGDHAVVDAG